jgi:hypothetical protein
MQMGSPPRPGRRSPTPEPPGAARAHIDRPSGQSSPVYSCGGDGQDGAASSAQQSSTPWLPCGATASCRSVVGLQPRLRPAPDHQLWREELLLHEEGHRPVIVHRYCRDCRPHHAGHDGHFPEKKTSRRQPGQDLRLVLDRPVCSTPLTDRSASVPKRPVKGSYGEARRQVGHLLSHQATGHWRAINPGVAGSLTVTSGTSNPEIRAVSGPDLSDSQAGSSGSIPVTRSWQSLPSSGR